MKKYKVTVNGTQYEIVLEQINESEIAAPAAPAQPAKAGGEEVTSPMPGTILAVNVTPGAKVKKGDVILVLEAMKMENEIMAPCDGTVASVSVTKGAAMDSGAVLCTIA